MHSGETQTDPRKSFGLQYSDLNTKFRRRMIMGELSGSSRKRAQAKPPTNFVSVLLFAIIEEIIAWKPLMRFAVYALVAFILSEAYSKNEDRRMQRMTDTITRDISSSNIKVRSVGNTVILEGHLYSKAERDRAIAIAEAHQRVWTFRSVFEKPQVLSLMTLNEVFPAF